MTTSPQPSSLSEALHMERAALEFLAAADPTEMSPDLRARCLQVLEQAHAMFVARRWWPLAALAANAAANIQRGVPGMS